MTSFSIVEIMEPSHARFLKKAMGWLAPEVRTKQFVPALVEGWSIVTGIVMGEKIMVIFGVEGEAPTKAFEGLEALDVIHF